MTSKSVRITQGADRIGTVHVDGHDISHAVYGATIRVQARKTPEVELGLLPHAVELVVDDGRVVIDQQTHDLLVRLGWTPPAGGAR